MRKVISAVLCLCVIMCSSFMCFAQTSLYSEAIIYADGTIETKNNTKQVNQIPMQQSIVYENNLKAITGKDFNLGLVKEYGVARLAKMIGDKYNENTSCNAVTKVSDTHYIISIVSTKSWATGNWNVLIYPYEDQYKIAPKGGWWYSYRDENNNIIGVCQASKAA